VETGNDGQRIVRLDDKHERVGKAAKQGAAHVLVDHGELPGTGAHALDHGVNRLLERNFHLCVAAGCGCVHGGDDLRNMGLHDFPPSLS
jgi:hypothetical protein